MGCLLKVKIMKVNSNKETSSWGKLDQQEITQNWFKSYQGENLSRNIFLCKG
jgi:hypothetical protein